jgi:NAD(P)H-hydrate epimerase
LIPVVTPEEMRAVDAAAPEPVEVLVARAGWATARAARRLLGGTYGRRVAVLAGPGNNGADGRAAARLLARAGVRCRVVDTRELPARLDGFDLVVDAAYGTGFRGRFEPPEVGSTPVLAVDIPSGVDGTTGLVGGRALPAAATVTFAAVKPGLLVGAGPDHTGPIEVVDIGLDVSGARAHLLEPPDLARWPRRPRQAHKWRSACWVVGGSPGMTGAPRLAVAGAQAAGAGYLRLSVPGDSTVTGPAEAVLVDLPALGWAGPLVDDHRRVKAVVIGPGLGAGAGTGTEVRRALAGLTTPVVVDGDGLRALGDRPEMLRDRPGPTVLTPHDGEYARLCGRAPGPDRLAAARDLARAAGSVVALKGPATVIAEPGGAALVSCSGDQRLATAGTGDVLAGMVGALLAQGVEPWQAAGLAALAHGLAASRGPAVGLVAGDVARLLPEVLADRPGGPWGGPVVFEGVPVR